ncbi:hypothetical protein M2352_001333 [Azospirillum fermentarium]|uniref:hypothetical protein n=1 Tax=Azospirillum fermentarium TaxID=1233114 RepID=UPI002227D972|nr:hypothetical protein [Azospirillum fermentarium]MCW2245742.1 hypothetical protein [Azospirillum fermentarium]
MDAMIKKVFLAAAIAISLSACGPQIPPINFSPPNVGPTQTKLNAEVKSITVTVARPEEATGPLVFGIEAATPLWKTAVEEALNKMAIFRDDAPQKVSLSVKVLKLDTPDFGMNFTTTSAARYEIIDRATGSIIFTTDVNSDGVVPVDYAFVGAVRARESINRSVQNNILQFLQQLQTVNLNRPMFPTGAPPAPAAKGTPTS